MFHRSVSGVFLFICLAVAAALPAPGNGTEAAERMRPKRIKPDERPFDPARDGIVAGQFIAYFRTDRSYGFNSLILQREGSMDWYRHVVMDKEGTGAFHLPAGEYFIAHWEPGDVTLTYYPQSATQAEGKYLPLSRIEVKAGEAVYFGTVVGRWYRGYKREGHDLVEIEDHFDEARAAVEKQYPGWGEKLQKSLLAITQE